MDVSRVARILGDIFWSSMIVLGLLIVAFFVLRALGRIGKGTPVAGFAGAAGRAATPAG